MEPAINPVKLKSVIKPTLKKTAKNKAAGFTLIELLVVIFIIAVISGGVVLGLGHVSRQAAVKKTAEKLAQILPLAQEYAALNSVVLRLQIQKNGYQFDQLVEKETGEGVWERLLEPEFLAPGHFPSYMSIKLKARSAEATLETLYEHPVVEILPTMDISPLLLSIGTEGEPNQYQLSIEENSSIQLKRIH